MNREKIIKGTGKAIGTVLEVNLILTGAVIGGIVILAGNKKAGKTIRKAGKVIGKFAGRTAKISTDILAETLKISKTKGYELGKAVGRRAVQSKVRIYGDPKHFFDEEKIVEASYNQTR